MTAGGTVRRMAVRLAMATSSGLYLVEQLCPGVTMLGLRRVPSRYTWWSDMALYTAARTCARDRQQYSVCISLTQPCTCSTCGNRETNLLSDVLGAFQVVISVRQNLRLYDGHDAVLARNWNQNKTELQHHTDTERQSTPY